MKEFFIRYYSDYQETYRPPLARFLPPLPSGTIRSWLSENIPQGSWIFDPFGTHPMLALEAVRAGYNVLIACNNPVISFMLEVLASAPTESAFLTAFANFAMLRRGEERTVTHLESIYQTQCNECKRVIPAQAFLWKKGESQPYGKIYQCRFCGDNGEREINAYDLEIIRKYGSELHRVRAIERAMVGIETSRNSVEEILQYLLPRQIYFLFTLLNRIEGITGLTKNEKVLFSALFLSVCDQANVLSSYPSARAHPRQLTNPPQFRENNLWLAFENAIQEWSLQSDPVPISYYPEIPQDQCGICLYRGRSRELVLNDQFPPLHAAVILFPRPNQAFWSLSALWSSWLWGKDAAASLQGVFERKRYDWQWHAKALDSVLSSLQKHISPSTPVFGIAPDIVKGFLFAIITAASHSGMRWNGMAYQEDEDVFQFCFDFDLSKNNLRLPSEKKDRLSLPESFLRDRNLPANFYQFSSVCLDTILKSLPPAEIMESDPRILFQRVTSLVEELLVDRDKWTIFSKGRVDLENQKWWLKNKGGTAKFTISDEVEREVLSFFMDHAEFEFRQIADYAYQKFKGINTPANDYIRLILESYGESEINFPKKWHINSHDMLDVRNRDVESIISTLIIIGHRLGFETNQEYPIHWSGKKANRPDYYFYPQTTCMLGPLLWEKSGYGRELDGVMRILVLPGSRAKLFLYKLEQDPRLEQSLLSRWKVMKFRHLRQLSERPSLSLTIWDTLLDRDPMGWEDATQLSMFDQV